MSYKKDWAQYTKYVILKVDKYGPYIKMSPYATTPEDYLLNASAWELFNYSADPKELGKALEWSNKAIKNVSVPNAEYLDTYANLLYKLGRTGEALNIEEKAAALDPKASDIKDNLGKIKKGEPTWVTQ